VATCERAMPVRQVAARVGRRGIELQRRERKFLEVGHRAVGSAGGADGGSPGPRSSAPSRRIIGPGPGRRCPGEGRWPRSRRGDLGAPRLARWPGVLLAVDQADAVGAAERHQRGQGDLGRVGAVREHRLAEEHAADAHAVQAADQFAVDPGLHAVHRPARCQARVGVAISGTIQVPSWPSRGVRRRPDHRSKALSKRISQPGVRRSAAASCAATGARLELGHRQHHARVGAPPQHRLARRCTRGRCRGW
jgi:hypothetical protein